MEMTHAPHIQQPRHPRHRETVRRVLDGAVEFRHFAGFDQLFAPHAHGYPVIGLVREGHRIMECNRTRYRLGPGQLLALNAGDAHGCVQEGATPLVYDSLALLDFHDCPPFAGPIVEDAEAIALMGFAAAGLTGVACYFLLENVALTFTSATAVGAIAATSPLFCALIALRRGQRPASPTHFAVGFALAMGGIVLVGTASGDAFAGNTADNLIGCALAFIAALVWSVYSTLVSRIADAGYDTLAATKRIFAWGLLFMMPAIPFAGAFPALGLTDSLVVANLLFLGLGASAACFATWNFAVKHLGAVVTSTYIYLVPALTGAASALVLGEPVTAPIVAGVALTIAGLMLSNRTKSTCKLHRSTPATQPDKAFLCRKLR